MKQKNLYLGIAKGLPIHSRESEQIVMACYDPVKLATIETDVIAKYQGVIDLVAKFRMRLNCMKDVSVPQLRDEAKFLIMNYPDYSMTDIDVAINLVTTNKLNMQLPYVINFSTLFMGQVLSAYDVFKRQQVKVMNAQADTIPLPEYQPSAAERVTTMKECIQLCHSHIIDGCRENFFNGMVYDFLRKTNRMILTEEMVTEAKKYASSRYGKYASSNTGEFKSIGQLTKEQKKAKSQIMRQYMIEYCLMDYFNKNLIEEILNSITEDQWQEKNQQ